MTLRASKGCSGWWTTTASRTLLLGGAVEGVEQLAKRYGGRPLLAGVLVGAGVGDHQRLGRGADRVEQQLPVLAADVALAGHRVAGQHVVAVDEPSRGNTPSSRPTRQTTRCGTDRIGTIVQTVSVPVRKLARVGRPASWRSSSARTSGSRRRRVGARARVGQHVAELALHLAGLPGVVVVDAGEQADAVARARSASRRSGCAPVSRSTTCCSRSTYSASRPARSTRLLPTSSSGSVVSSQACESSDIATPASTRSRPNRQVFWTKSTP